MKTLTKFIPCLFLAAWCHAATVEVTNVPQATAAGTNTSFLAVTNPPAGTKTRLVSGALWLLVLKQHMTNLNNLHIDTDLVVDGTITATTLDGTLIASNQESVITAHLANPEGTNITLQAWEQEAFIGTSNVNLVAIMQGNTNAHYVTITITNGTGVTWGLSFSAVTNRWTWMYAKAAPTVMTNATQLVIATRVIGTNVLAAYDYAPWP